LTFDQTEGKQHLQILALATQAGGMKSAASFRESRSQTVDAIFAISSMLQAAMFF
jgi:hypothetical protein